MTIQQQIENTEKAIQYYTEMIEKFPDNESMRFAKQEQEEKLRELKEKLILNNPGYNQKILIKNSDRREPIEPTNNSFKNVSEIFVKHKNSNEMGIAYELSGQRLVDQFKDMEEEIFRLKKENQELNTKVKQLSRNNSAYQTLLQLLDFKDNQIKELGKENQELKRLKESTKEEKLFSLKKIREANIKNEKLKNKKITCINEEGDEQNLTFEELEREYKDLVSLFLVRDAELDEVNKKLSEEFNLRESLNKIIESQAIVIKNLEGELHLKNNRFLEVSKHTLITQLVNENKTAVEKYQNSIVEAMMNKSK